jgi:hypothetical protein
VIDEPLSWIFGKPDIETSRRILNHIDSIRTFHDVWGVAGAGFEPATFRL